MSRHASRVTEARALFEKFEIDPTDNRSLDRAVQICNDLCMNPFYPENEKFVAFELLAEKQIDVAIDILARWRDSLRFLSGRELVDTTNIIVRSVKCELLPSHERIYTSIQLYNLGFIHVCYECFLFIAGDESIEIENRTEAIRFLVAGERAEEALEFLKEITSNHNYSAKFRYETIASYISKTGIVCKMNMAKLKVPYNEKFAWSLQHPFFNDVTNDVRYRILSGQHLLQMSDDTVSDDEKHLISEALLDIARDARTYDENTRADAADVVFRCGNSSDRFKARQLTTQMGMSADGEKRKTIVPKSLYDNSQNIHNEEIDSHIQTFISKMLSAELDVDSRKTYHEVNEEISTFVRSLTDITPKERHAVYKALNRVSIDTATFTEHNATLSEILIFVWARIHSGEFSEETITNLKRRMVDELMDMSDTCSSGHAGRFVNVLSTVDDTLRISWSDQISANAKGRMQARIRDCPDPDLQASIALGMMEDADQEDREIYIKFIREQLDILEKELYEEFVGEGYLKEAEFCEHFSEVRKEWIGDLK